MATRIELFEITTTAGTASTSPVDTDLAMFDGTVDEVEITIPGGHAGLTGIALFHSGQQVIPYKAGDFLRGDGQTLDWPLRDYPTGAAWVARTYNTDVYDHTHHIRLLITDVPATLGLELSVTPVVVTGEATGEELASAAQLPEPTEAELAELAEVPS